MSIEKIISEAYYDGGGFDYLGNVTRLKNIVAAVKESGWKSPEEVKAIIDTCADNIRAARDGYVQVAPDQKLPELSEQSGLTEEDKIAYAHYSAGYSNGQQRMLRAHDNGDGTETVWMKVIRKKEGIKSEVQAKRLEEQPLARTQGFCSSADEPWPG